MSEQRWNELEPEDRARLEEFARGLDDTAAFVANVGEVIDGWDGLPADSETSDTRWLGDDAPHGMPTDDE